MSKMKLYLEALKQRRQVYYDYARLDYTGTDVLTANRLYQELGDEVDTIISELGGLVKQEVEDGD